MKWSFGQPVFAYERDDPNIVQRSAWVGHRYFAYDLIRNVKPRVVVELGTHMGLSFFSFCQAVVDCSTGTKCYAVDSWVGDSHTGGYEEAVYETVSRVAKAYYAPAAELLRGTFDEALSQFADQSVDVLHIDGYHTYEAAAHDFYTWLPKMADNGIVLFHDINVRIGNFGVYRLWEELRRQYPGLAFDQSHGLGVLFPKGCSELLQDMLLHEKELKMRYR
ncbi:class I SAM-dependent methyltransferase [Paenibacillus thalictri]|nr:class I SAM-dependent methyltransferase [Paenibacillus thalictri]